jgi:hypothetical protein
MTATKLGLLLTLVDKYRDETGGHEMCSNTRNSMLTPEQKKCSESVTLSSRMLGANSISYSDL